MVFMESRTHLPLQWWIPCHLFWPRQDGWINAQPLWPTRMRDCTQKYIPGSSWSSIVKNQCISIFEERFASYILPIKDESVSWGESKHGNPVRLLTAKYFRRDFKAENMEMNRLIDDTVASFSLNTKQERAFWIITNHVSAPTTEQLKMYLGEMVGIRKSQVIKAIIYFVWAEEGESVCVRDWIAEVRSKKL